METAMKNVVATATPRTFREKEAMCQSQFNSLLYKYGQAWHLCTPGENQEIIFRTEADYEFTMTLVAMCAYDCPDTRIITFELMSNHVHFVIFGMLDNVLRFFNLLKKRLMRYLCSLEYKVNLDRFEPKTVPIKTLEELRRQIIYTNRNNFVVDPSQTPFSYRYGANSFFCSPIAKKEKKCCLKDLSNREQRAMMHTHNVNYPGDYIIIESYISPISYCDIEAGEKMFRDFRHYFDMLYRDVEAYKEIAAALNDMVFYTDDELMSIIRKKCNQDFDGQPASLLNPQDKQALAKTLHYEYNAGNNQISRMLKLPESYVNELFPARAKGVR